MSRSVLAGLCRAGDCAFLVLVAAVHAGLEYRQGLLLHPGQTILIDIIAVTFARSMLEQQNLYTLSALLKPLRLASRLALCVLSGGILGMLASLLLQWNSLDATSSLQPLEWSAAGAAGIIGVRSMLGWRLREDAARGRLATKIALIGANEYSAKFIQDAGKDASLRIIGVFDDRTSRAPEGAIASQIRGTVNDLLAYASRHAVDAVVIALPLTATARIQEMQQRLIGIAADIFVTTDIAGLSFSGAQFAVLGTSPVVAVVSHPLKDWPAFKKAVFDRIVSAALLILGLPLLAAIAAAVKFDSPGPILFRQQREGYNGASFTMLKFRTMRHGGKRDDPSIQATRRDPRVTRVGYWLRRTSLDELPQLLNVLRGDMSLVGPRPHLATTRIGDRTFHEVVPGYQARHRMKPGLTGWAQVQGLRGETKTEQEIADRVAQDLYYINHWSIGFDLRIMLRTLQREIVSTSGKAY